MAAAPHPLATPHIPFFITAPGESDAMLANVAIVLVGAVLLVGTFYLKLHSLPERMAHKTKKLQFDIVALLCLLALFTHNHAFWVAGLLLAYIDLPDFGSPLRRIARSTEKLAGIEPPPEDEAAADDAGQHGHGETTPASDVAPARPAPIAAPPPAAQPALAAAAKAKEA